MRSPRTRSSGDTSGHDAVADHGGRRARQERDPVQRPLGADLLDDADHDVGRDHRERHDGVHRAPHQDQGDAEREQDVVDERERVLAQDLEVGARRRRQRRVAEAGRAAALDLGGGQPSRRRRRQLRVAGDRPADGSAASMLMAGRGYDLAVTRRRGSAPAARARGGPADRDGQRRMLLRIHAAASPTTRPRNSPRRLSDMSAVWQARPRGTTTSCGDLDHERQRERGHDDAGPGPRGRQQADEHAQRHEQEDVEARVVEPRVLGPRSRADPGQVASTGDGDAVEGLAAGGHRRGEDDPRGSPGAAMRTRGRCPARERHGRTGPRQHDRDDQAGTESGVGAEVDPDREVPDQASFIDR